MMISILLGVLASRPTQALSIIHLGISTFFSWVLYYCAYKNLGTKLVAFYLFLHGLGCYLMLTTLGLIVESPFSFLFLSGLQVSCFWSTFKVKEINKKIKLLSMGTAIKSAAAIKNCWDPKNLHQVFSKTIQSYPSYEPLLTYTFNNRQDLFKKILEKDPQIAELAKQEFRETLASTPNLNINSFEWLLQQMPELKEDIENHLKTS